MLKLPLSASANCHDAPCPPAAQLEDSFAGSPRQHLDAVGRTMHVVGVVVSSSKTNPANPRRINSTAGVSQKGGQLGELSLKTNPGHPHDFIN